MLESRKKHNFLMFRWLQSGSLCLFYEVIKKYDLEQSTCRRWCPFVLVYTNSLKTLFSNLLLGINRVS